MARKELWKIVLQPDGSWKNVYRDAQENKQAHAESFASLYVKSKNNRNSLNDLQADIIELALEHSDYEESKVVLERAMRR